jgi:hypothetical protein
MNGTISGRKSIMAAIAGVSFAIFLIAAHGQNPAFPSESSRIRTEGSTPTPPPGPDTGGKVNVKTAEDIDAEARAKGNRGETMVIEAGPSKRSTPSPEFAGSLLDAGLTRTANKKESAKAPAQSSSPSTKSSPTEKSAPVARPTESPGMTLKLDQTEAPSLSLGITPRPNATASATP